MTDVSKLAKLAAAISSKSPAIRAYALAQAAATVSQEKELEMLRGSGVLPRGGVPIPEPPAPPTGPITISTGGTYTGLNILGTNTVPAVTITTADPVTITNSILSNFTDGVDAPAVILVDVNGVNLQVINNYVYGGSGRFVTGENGNDNGLGFQSVLIRNNTIEKTAGIQFNYGMTGSTLTVTKNKHTNIRDNGYLQAYPDHGTPGNFVQVRHVWRATIDISWNQIVNEYAGTMAQYLAGAGSWPEDIISIWKSSNAHIHNNYIQHNSTPGNGAEELATPQRQEASSQGVITLDGDGSADPLAVSNNTVEYNQMVDVQNAIYFTGSGSHDNMAQYNRCVSNGYLPDGITACYYGGGAYAMVSGGSNNHMHNNVSGYVYGTRSGGGRGGDYQFANNGHDPTTETNLNTTLASPITQAMEAAEWTTWLTKLATNSITVGAS